MSGAISVDRHEYESKAKDHSSRHEGQLKALNGDEDKMPSQEQSKDVVPAAAPDANAAAAGKSQQTCKVCRRRCWLGAYVLKKCNRRRFCIHALSTPCFNCSALSSTSFIFAVEIIPPCSLREAR